MKREMVSAFISAAAKSRIEPRRTFTKRDDNRCV
jgi:hypothetical protein